MKPRSLVLVPCFLVLAACPARVERRAPITTTPTASPSALITKSSFPEPAIETPRPRPPEVLWAKFTPAGLIAALPGIRLAVSVDDGRTWRDITPPSVRHVFSEGGAEPYVIDVDFVSPTRGWAVVGSPAADPLVVLRTSDGGRHWRSVSVPEHLGHHGGSTANVSFADATSGWLANEDPVSPGTQVWRTRDGGRTWKRVPFDLSSSGLVHGRGADHAYLVPVIFGGNKLHEMSDGVHWVERRLPVPKGVRAEQGSIESLVASPSGAIASLAFAQDGRIAVGFYRTQRTGWASVGTLRSGRVPTEDMVKFPVRVSIASTSVWWVIEVGSAPRVHRTVDGGGSWFSRPATGLPGGERSVVAFSARDERVATVVGSDPTSEGRLFVTRDGGRTWTHVRPRIG